MRVPARVLLLALALTVALAVPAAHAELEGGTNSVGVWAGYEWNNQNGKFSDGKWGIDYEYRLPLRMLPDISLGLSIPFQYYSPAPEIQTNLGEFHLNTTVWTIMPTVKVYWTGLKELHLTPYAGAGVGWGHVDYDDPIDDSDNGLAWRVVAGAEYDIPIVKLPFAVFGEYEYSEVDATTAQPILGIGDNADLGANALQAGVRVRF